MKKLYKENKQTGFTVGDEVMFIKGTGKVYTLVGFESKTMVKLCDGCNRYTHAYTTAICKKIESGVKYMIDSTRPDLEKLVGTVFKRVRGVTSLCSMEYSVEFQILGTDKKFFLSPDKVVPAEEYIELEKGDVIKPCKDINLNNEYMDVSISAGTELHVKLAYNQEEAHVVDIAIYDPENGDVDIRLYGVNYDSFDFDVIHDCKKPDIRGVLYSSDMPEPEIKCFPYAMYNPKFDFKSIVKVSGTDKVHADDAFMMDMCAFIELDNLKQRVEKEKSEWVKVNESVYIGSTIMVNGNIIKVDAIFPSGNVMDIFGNVINKNEYTVVKKAVKKIAKPGDTIVIVDDSVKHPYKIRVGDTFVVIDKHLIVYSDYINLFIAHDEYMVLEKEDE